MIHLVRRQDPEFQQLLELMHEDRKRMFVDLLGWDVPVVDGRLEVDQFDDDHAIYLIAVDLDDNHVGSLRLLPSERPHILGSLFPQLCPQGVPAGSDIFEITRLCLPSRLGTVERLRVRNRLISAMVNHALATGIRSLTGVVETSFLAQILVMGWRCAALTPAQAAGAARLGSFIIHVDATTPTLLARKNIYVPGCLQGIDDREIAHG